jgi:alkanesulfonate monooxygenase SsuD/methylene tetrahydromethanopterin reductase-like flavin-dependent oxidoreductase (luciferase family)
MPEEPRQARPRLQFGIGLRSFVSESLKPTSVYQQVEECAEMVRFMAALGTIDAIRSQHHWLSYPTEWIEPLPLLARLAPEAGQMQLMTSVLKLPIHNPVELAHLAASLDHICNGRFVLGIGIGYAESELEAVGSSRRERASRLEESLTLMKALWSGEEVNFEGRYWSVHNARMGLLPAQKPHPPIWNASYSAAATRRAARMCDAVLIAPQASWHDVAQHARLYRETLAECGKSGGLVGVNRTVSIARTAEEAAEATRRRVEEAAAYYGAWGMREATTGDIVLEADRNPKEWAVSGTPAECVEELSRFRDEIGIEFIGLRFTNMPREQSARKEFLQYVSEEVLSKLR